MRIAVGILLLIVGVSYPVAIMFWLNRRLSRQPALQPRQVGWILAFNGTFPVAVIALGLGMLSARLWAALGFRLVVLFAACASVVLLIGIWRGAASARDKRGNDGRGTSSTDL